MPAAAGRARRNAWYLRPGVLGVLPDARLAESGRALVLKAGAVRRRLGVSDTPVASNGPVIAMSRRCGSLGKSSAAASGVLAMRGS